MSSSPAPQKQQKKPRFSFRKKGDQKPKHSFFLRVIFWFVALLVLLFSFWLLWNHFEKRLISSDWFPFNHKKDIQNKPLDKPLGKLLDRPLDKPLGKPLDKPLGKLLDKPLDRPLDQKVFKKDLLRMHQEILELRQTLSIEQASNAFSNLRFDASFQFLERAFSDAKFSQNWQRQEVLRHDLVRVSLQRERGVKLQSLWMRFQKEAGSTRGTKSFSLNTLKKPWWKRLISIEKKPIRPKNLSCELSFLNEALVMDRLSLRLLGQKLKSASDVHCFEKEQPLLFEFLSTLHIFEFEASRPLESQKTLPGAF